MEIGMKNKVISGQGFSHAAGSSSLAKKTGMRVDKITHFLSGQRPQPRMNYSWPGSLEKRR
jgi:hypothetical protein